MNMCGLPTVTHTLSNTARRKGFQSAGNQKAFGGNSKYVTWSKL